jgi:superfamily II DNA or RNA helicase
MIERGPRVLLQCPTGGGKTVIASFITQQRVMRGGTVRFMCCRDFLVDQTSGTFNETGIKHSFMANGRWTNVWDPVHVCMIQSMKKRLAAHGAPHMAIWDEAHHIAARTWKETMEAWGPATHIGLSATPCRADGKGLDAYFDDIVIGPSVAHLMDIGALSQYRYFAPTSPDLSGMHTRMGDYVQSEIDDEMGKAVIIGNLVTHYAKHARGMKAVYFCTSIKNSMETVAAFNQKGFRFIHLDGDHSSHERGQAALALARGDIDGISNVALFGEGFDLAAAASQAAGRRVDVTIDCVGLARPTKSLSLSRQQIGRALRPKPYPAIILDHAGHLKEFGLPDDDVEWTLSGGKRSNPVKYIECENCGCANPSTAFECVNCHATIERKSRGGAAGAVREVEHVDGELQEIDRAAARRRANMEQGQARTIEDLIALATRRGYKRPEAWAGHIWQARVMKGARR